MWNQRTTRKASQPKYLGVLSEKILRGKSISEKTKRCSYQPNTAHYIALPRVSTDYPRVSTDYPRVSTDYPRLSTESHLGNLIEENENTPVHLNDRLSIHDESEYGGVRGIKFTFRTRPIARLLAVISIVFSIITLTLMAVRLSSTDAHRGWDCKQKLVAPTIAFSAFDILVHLSAIICVVHSHIFQFRIISTEHSPTRPEGIRACSKSKDRFSPRTITAAVYFVEILILVSLIIGVSVDMAYTHQIPGKIIGQIFGWMTVATRLACFVAWPMETKVTMSILFTSTTSSQIYPERKYQDLEECGDRVQEEEVQTESSGQEQMKGLI